MNEKGLKKGCGVKFLEYEAMTTRQLWWSLLQDWDGGLIFNVGKFAGYLFEENIKFCAHKLLFIHGMSYFVRTNFLFVPSEIALSNK